MASPDGRHRAAHDVPSGRSSAVSAAASSAAEPASPGSGVPSAAAGEDSLAGPHRGEVERQARSSAGGTHGRAPEAAAHRPRRPGRRAPPRPGCAPATPQSADEEKDQPPAPASQAPEPERPEQRRAAAPRRRHRRASAASGAPATARAALATPSHAASHAATTAQARSDAAERHAPTRPSGSSRRRSGCRATITRSIASDGGCRRAGPREDDEVGRLARAPGGRASPTPRAAPRRGSRPAGRRGREAAAESSSSRCSL